MFDSSNNKVYITYFGTGMLTIIGESLKEKSSTQSFYVFLGIAIVILVGGGAAGVILRNSFIKIT